MNMSELSQLLLKRISNFTEDGEAKAIVRELLFQLTGKRPPYSPDDLVKDVLEAETLRMADRLERGEPLQYILGKTFFRDFELLVNPSVLIPRPETAELPDIVMEDVENPPAKILDLGTGSGCLAIALSKLFPAAEVFAYDVSLEALQTASNNARINEVQIRFSWTDMNDDEFFQNTNRFDLIVSNPPYISTAEAGKMERNVLDFEPHLALFAPADDPLHFYRRIAVFAAGHLTENGSVWLEINPLFADETSVIFKRIGMRDVRIYADLSGKDRFIAAWRKAFLRICSV